MWTESGYDWLNEINPDKISAWKPEAISPPAEELCQLIAAGTKRFRSPQEWGPWEPATHAPGDGVLPCTTRSSKKSEQKEEEEHEDEEEEKEEADEEEEEEEDERR